VTSSTRPIARSQFLAMGVLAALAAGLAFLVGVEVGRRPTSPGPPGTEAPGLVSEAVRSGDLEDLLAQVERADRVALGFPADLAARGLPTSSPDLPTTGWALDLAGLGSAREAEARVAALRAAAVPAYRVAALVEGHAVQRLRVGGFASEELALAAVPSVLATTGYGGAKLVAAP
jgi:hypothetical protein